MRKLKDLSSTELATAVVLTKIQEWSTALALLSEGRLSAFFSSLLAWATDAHFKLFYGSSIEEVVRAVKSLPGEHAAVLAKNTLVPACIRTSKIQLKVARKFKGHKSTPSEFNFRQWVLLTAMLKNCSTGEAVSHLEKALDKMNAKVS